MKTDVLARLKDLTRPTGTEDLLRVEYPRPRFHISLKHAVIAAIAVVILGVGWLVYHKEAATPPSVSTLVASSAATSSELSTEIVVSVVGHVSNPGLVTLKEGDRVADALAAAGAFPDADVAALNLAQVLSDGTQINVLAIGQAPPPDANGAGGVGSEAGTGLISLNSATIADLITLPGVGEKTAQAIIDYRDAQGGFGAVDELLGVKGIGQAKFEQIKPAVSL
ncbi:ComEA family DNA-binding protein [Corynebacterium callunae]|uniref:ComEA family DNA-binding protein n=1 Tax=Corynebacterium callunae TaxID=1721 RepID=UPI0039827919